MQTSLTRNASVALYHGLLLGGFLVGSIPLTGCDHQPSAPTGEQITLKEELTPVEKLVLRLVNSGYARGLDQNDYYLSFRAMPPETVVIILKHSDSNKTKKLAEIIESAKGVIIRMGKQDFGIRDLKVEEEVSRLSPEDLPERLQNRMSSAGSPEAR